MHNLAEAGFPAGESYPGGALLLAWLAFIRDSLAHVEEDLRKAAVAAFRAVTQAYLVSTSEGQACFDVECLVPLTAVLRASTSQCHKRMGAARALGDTPPALALRFANQVGFSRRNRSNAYFPVFLLKQAGSVLVVVVF